MNKSLASFILSGHFAAFTAVFGFSLLAFIFPLSAIISGGAIVLITLHAGPNNGFLIAASCATALAVCSYAFLGHPILGIAAALSLFVPSLILATIYYRTKSLSFSLQAAVILGALAFLGIVVAFPNINQSWENVLNNMLGLWLDSQGYSAERKTQLVQISAQFMSGMLIASIVLMHSSALMLGRWWQCLRADSKDYQQEFLEFRLGKVLAIVAVLLGTWAIVANSIFAAQLCIIICILFFLEGMAVIHKVTAAMTKGKVWLIITYLLVVFLPQAFFIVMLLGITEEFINIRKRV